MSTQSRAKRERSRQMLAIAKRYYFDDESMVTISAQLGISRFKVARLLKEARETGMVSIIMNTGGDEDPELSRRVAEHLGLQKARVVEAYGDLDEVRRTVGEAASGFLAGTLQAGETLGLAWGRTLTYMIGSLHQLPDVQILQLNGAVGSDLSQSPIEMLRRAALVSGNRAKALMAPLYIHNLQAAQALRRQPDLEEVFTLYDTVTTAVVAVGGFQDSGEGNQNSRFLPLLPPAARKQLLDNGAVAEVCGLPFRADGSLADPELVKHVLAISPDQLRRVPRVIAVASNPNKAEAILAIVRAGLISELIVDDDLAEALLAAPPPVSGRAG